MKIPKSVRIFGKNIEVVFDKKLISEKGRLGEASCTECVIRLAPVKNEGDLSHTFWHECLHCILYEMGEAKLRSNEKFVNVLAGMINEVITSTESKNGR